MPVRHHRRRTTTLFPATLGLTGVMLMILAFAALSLTGCAGGPPGAGPDDGPRGTGPDGAEGRTDGWRAAPVALLLVGLDADRDGFTTRAELEQVLPALYRQADADGAGGIAPLEYQAWATAAFGTADARPGRMAFDADGDGRIDRPEFDTALRAAFQAADRDGDGRVGRAELVTYVPPARSGGPAAGGGGRGGMPGPRPR